MVEDGMNNPLPLRPQQSPQPGQQGERQQAELRNNYESTRRYDQEQLRQREERIKKEYGPKLLQAIERSGVDDEHIKAIAADALAKNLAAYVGVPDPIDITRLSTLSILQAYKIEALQHEQLKQQQYEQRPDEQSRRQPEPHQGRYYAELNETHRIVGEEITSARSAPSEQNNFENEQVERSHLGRYADLGVTHQLVDVELSQREEATARQAVEMERTTSSDRSQSTTEKVELKGEQSDRKSETDDRAQTRQARVREFGREIEEQFHRELDQDGGRDRGG
jgi:hypothetical protein